MKCENCGIYNANRVDFREIDGITSKLCFCEWCYKLNDVTLYQIRRDKLDPVTFYNPEWRNNESD